MSLFTSRLSHSGTAFAKFGARDLREEPAAVQYVANVCATQEYVKRLIISDDASHGSGYYRQLTE